MCAMRIRDRPVVLETPLIRTLHVDQRAGLGVDAVVNPLQPPVQPHHLVLDIAIREGIRSGSVGHGAEDDLSLVSKAAQMFVVRDVATEQIVAQASRTRPGIPPRAIASTSFGMVLRARHRSSKLGWRMAGRS